MTILDRLLQHDASTTRALLLLSANLPEAAIDREFDIGHRSLRRTLTHIVENMECWCDLMNAHPQRNAPGTKSPAAVGALIERLDIVAAELLMLGQSVEKEKREEKFFLDYLDQPPRQKPFGAGLVHIATHGMHHRAQCLYIMRQLGMTNLIEGDAIGWERGHRGLEHWPSG